MIPKLLSDRHVRTAGIGVLIACGLLMMPLPREWLALFGDYGVIAGLILIALTALASGRERIRHVEERRFWDFVAAALAAWLAVIVILVAAPADRSAASELAIDGGYLLFYVFMLAAATANPHLAPGSRLGNRRYVVDALGTLLLAGGLLVYFAYVPSVLNVAAYNTALPSMLLYTVFDTTLSACFFYLAFRCPAPRWRYIYGAVAFATLTWAILDVGEALMFAGTIPMLESGTPIDLVWTLPFFTVICAIRMRELAPAAAATGRPRQRGDALKPALRGPFLVYALAAPVLHYSLYGIGALDEASRSARELTVVALLVVLGFLAVIQHRLVEEERRRAERERGVSEARYRELFERSPSANYVSSWDGRLLACNLAFARIFGFDSVEEALSCPATALYARPQDRTRFLEQLLRRGRFETEEWELRRRDGSTVRVLESSELVSDEAGRPREIRGQMIDITEHRHLEEQLRQSQKLEAIGLLAGGVAHDFNNLLTGITGHAELALHDLGDESRVAEDLCMIRSCADRGASLVAQLLAFSRRQPLDKTVLDVEATIGDACDMLQRVIGEDIALEFTAAPDVGRIRADPGQVQQVLVNLAVNARDAMPDGGRLTIVVDNHDIGETTPEQFAAPKGRWVRLRINDTGCGMDEETIGRIFDPFFTTKEVGKGTGLGLATVYGIVRQHGGHVDALSTPGHGSTFRIWLPRVDDEVEPRKAAAAPDTERSDRRRRSRLRVVDA